MKLTITKAYRTVNNHYQWIVRNPDPIKGPGYVGMPYHPAWIGKPSSAEAYIAALPGYSPDGPRTLQLDIVNHALGFAPGNLRWITETSNGRSRNSLPGKTNNVMLNYKGETHNMSEWCERLNLDYGTVTMRLRRGWTHTRALSTPTPKLWTPR